jgi:hypothetical protein
MPPQPGTGPFDVFISHASEDKQAVARPLAEALRHEGFTVWLDEDEMRLGDSLHRVLDRGLSSARFGIVVLSPSFFAKAWTKSELGALLALEIEVGRTMVLPVWHGVGQVEVLRHAPLLADRIGVSTADGLDHVVQEVVAAVGPAPRATSSQPPRVTGRPAALPAEDRLLRAVPLALLSSHSDPLVLAPGEDGAARSLAVAFGDRIVIGRAGARQLHGRARQVLERGGHDRVHWVTHWDDTALNQLSVELGHRSLAGRSTLTVENLTAYATRQTTVEIVDASGGSRHTVAAGERFESAGDGGMAWVLVLGQGTGAQRLLHLVLEPVRCGSVGVPIFRTEGALFWVPPGDPAARLVRFFGLWLPLTVPELTRVLREARAELTVRFLQGRLTLTVFVDPEAGAMVISDGESLEQALGLV